MKIAVISKADAFGGGASRVAAELCTLLNAAGHESDHWLSWAGGKSPHDRALYGKLRLPVRAANWGLRKAGLPEFVPFELAVLLYRGRIFEYDLIHFHDLSSAISPWTLLYLSRKKPVVWTIHDCSPFTGGCLYPMDCEYFKTRCGECPQLGAWPIDSLLDFTGTNQDIKRRLANSARIKYVTPSKWMQNTAMDSKMFSHPPLLLHNGVDTDQFGFLDKVSIRATLGLPTDRVCVLLSAGSLLDERKGVRFAIEALQQTRDLRPLVILVGHSNPALLKSLIGLDLHKAGYIGDASILAQYYAASDLLMFTSLADNQPLTILETMSAGTPVVGFATGGIPEMVVQNETGFLVSPRDVSALTVVLRRALGDKELLRRWSIQGRLHVEQHFSHQKFLSGHLALYQQLLDAWNHVH